jgi:hypothetical protein
MLVDFAQDMSSGFVRIVYDPKVRAASGVESVGHCLFEERLEADGQVTT